jgi:hypothetical protein
MIMCRCRVKVVGSIFLWTYHISEHGRDEASREHDSKELEQETWLFVKAFHNIIIHRLKNRGSHSRLLKVVQPKEKHRNSNRHRHRTNTESRKQRRAVVSITAKAKHKHYWVT